MVKDTLCLKVYCLLNSLEEQKYSIMFSMYSISVPDCYSSPWDSLGDLVSNLHLWKNTDFKTAISPIVCTNRFSTEDSGIEWMNENGRGLELALSGSFTYSPR